MQDEPKKLAPSVRIVIGVVAALAIVGGLVQLRRGRSETRGGDGPDYAAIAADARRVTTSFISPDGDFELSYPGAWEIEPQHRMVFEASTLHGVVNCNVGVDQVAADVTVEAYAHQVITTSATTMHGLKEVHREAAMVGTLPAIRTEMTFPLGTGATAITAHDTATFVVANGRGYALTCTTEDSGFATLAPVFAAVARSFELTK